MKKLLPLITVLTLLFTSCYKSNPIVGGRYFGTFYNTTNGLQEEGSLTFKKETCNYRDTIIKINGKDTTVKICDTIFVMNNLLKIDSSNQIWKLRDTLIGDTLTLFLKTMPAIDNIQVCDSTTTIKRLDKMEIEFKGGTVKTDFLFFTANKKDSIEKKVIFVGNN